MQLKKSLLLGSSLISLVNALPLPLGLADPKVITRMHTADAVTTTEINYHTVTSTIPIVEILISNGVTFTKTLFTTASGDDIANVQASTTVVINDATTTPVAATVAKTTAAAVAATTEAAVTPNVADTTSTAAPAAADPITTSSTSIEAATTQNAVPNAATTATPKGVTTSTSTTSSRPTATAELVGAVFVDGSVASSSVASPDDGSNVNTTSPAPNKPVAGNGDSTTSTKSTATSSTTTAAAATTTSSPSSDYASSVIPSAIVYSPYENDGTCKDYSAVESDLNYVLSKGVGEVRIYGNDCNYLTTVLPICKKLGLKINQGFWISSSGVNSIDTAVSELIDSINDSSNENSWDLFSYITIGNEAIISGFCTVDELISKISSVKTLLQQGGYTGQVTTSEPPVIFGNYPSLCRDSEIDFVGINSHSYFDTYSSAETAGSFVSGQISLAEGYCPGMKVVVTETGYPSAGIQNGGNIPSEANQKIAIGALLETVGADITLLSLYNDYWKNPGPYGIEQSFGVGDIIV